MVTSMASFKLFKRLVLISTPPYHNTNYTSNLMSLNVKKTLPAGLVKNSKENSENLNQIFSLSSLRRKSSIGLAGKLRESFEKSNQTFNSLAPRKKLPIGLVVNLKWSSVGSDQTFKM